MPFYFYKGAYTQQVWAALVADPRDVSDALSPSIEKFDGKVVACFLFTGINGAEPAGFIEFPDTKDATAWTIHLLAKGVLSRADITPVLTTQDGLDALKKIGSTSSSSGSGW